MRAGSRISALLVAAITYSKNIYIYIYKKNQNYNAVTFVKFLVKINATSNYFFLFLFIPFEWGEEDLKNNNPITLILSSLLKPSS